MNTLNKRNSELKFSTRNKMKKMEKILCSKQEMTDMRDAMIFQMKGSR